MMDSPDAADIERPNEFSEGPAQGNLAALRFGWNTLAPMHEPRPCGRQTQREEQLPEQSGSAGTDVPPTQFSCASPPARSASSASRSADRRSTRIPA